MLYELRNRLNASKLIVHTKCVEEVTFYSNSFPKFLFV